MINAFSNRLFSSKRQFDWKYEIVGIFGILSKGQQQKKSTQLKTQKLSQMSKSILQKEWSYVVWDESADIWCCFSSFYSVQVRAEISGYPELSSRLWSFTRSCSMKNVLRLGFGIFHFHSVTQIFSHGSKKKKDWKVRQQTRNFIYKQCHCIWNLATLVSWSLFIGFKNLKFCKLLSF